MTGVLCSISKGDLTLLASSQLLFWKNPTVLLRAASKSLVAFDADFFLTMRRFCSAFAQRKKCSQRLVVCGVACKAAVIRASPQMQCVTLGGLRYDRFGLHFRLGKTNSPLTTC